MGSLMMFSLVMCHESDHQRSRWQILQEFAGLANLQPTHFRHGLAFSAQLFEVIDDLSNSKYCARLPDLGDARVSPHRKDQSRLDRQAPQLLRLPG